mmetsp:Transcript_33499/g.75182  ORF Transcript_33499/g.75182 Transcript_33499/m.75182 type:complete len:337 (-) Transcript_33499:50-1060(-)
MQHNALLVLVGFISLIEIDSTKLLSLEEGISVVDLDLGFAGVKVTEFDEEFILRRERNLDSRLLVVAVLAAGSRHELRGEGSEAMLNAEHVVDEALVGERSEHGRHQVKLPVDEDQLVDRQLGVDDLVLSPDLLPQLHQHVCYHLGALPLALQHRDDAAQHLQLHDRLCRVKQVRHVVMQLDFSKGVAHLEGDEVVVDGDEAEIEVGEGQVVEDSLLLQHALAHGRLARKHAHSVLESANVLHQVADLLGDHLHVGQVCANDVDDPALRDAQRARSKVHRLLDAMLLEQVEVKDATEWSRQRRIDDQRLVVACHAQDLFERLSPSSLPEDLLQRLA